MEKSIQEVIDILQPYYFEDGNLSWLNLGKEVYCLLDLEKSVNYVYLPLDKVALKLNSQQLFKLILAIESSEQVVNDKAIEKILTYRSEDNGSNILNQLKEDTLQHEYESLTLSPTSACQLACEYCYINGGDNPRNLKLEDALLSIDYKIQEVLNNNKERLHVEFHGQGEPTSNWNLFTKCVEYIIEQCDSKGIKYNFGVVTNGILNNKQISYLAQYNFSLSLSLDGVGEYNDTNRPLRSGKSSSKKAIESIKKLEAVGIDVHVRSVVTNGNIDHLKDFVKFLDLNTNVKRIEMEPISLVGRATSTDMSGIEIVKYVKTFKEVSSIAKERGMTIGSSLKMYENLKSTYCGAYGKNLNFVVSTEGVISSCYEILDEDDPRMPLFAYGKIIDGEIQIDESRKSVLENLDVNNFSHCNNCYAKWHCAGGCISRNIMGGSMDTLYANNDKGRCYSTRFFAKDTIINLVNQ